MRRDRWRPNGGAPSPGPSYAGNLKMSSISLPWDTLLRRIMACIGGEAGELLLTKCLVKPIVMSPSEFDRPPHAAGKHSDAVCASVVAPVAVPRLVNSEAKQSPDRAATPSTLERRAVHHPN
jgi:hypothetical protein